MVQRVELVVVEDDLLGGFGVAVLQHDDDAVGGHRQELLHLGEQLRGLGRQRRFGVDAACSFGDVLRQIAHALEGRGEPQRRYDDSQVGRHRVLLGEQTDALVDDAGFEGIDLDVAVDDALGGFDILLQQGVSGPVDGLAHVLHHAIEVIGNGLELLVKNNAHCCSLSCYVVALDGTSIKCKPHKLCLPSAWRSGS